MTKAARIPGKMLVILEILQVVILGASWRKNPPAEEGEEEEEEEKKE